MPKITKSFLILFALAITLNANPTRIDTLSMRIDSLAKAVATQINFPAKIEIVKAPAPDTVQSSYERQDVEESKLANKINRNMTLASWAGAVFGGIALIISIGAVFYTVGQSHKQLRAYIDLKMNSEGTEVEYSDGSMTYFPIQFTIKNVGQTPAMNCEIEVSLIKKSNHGTRKIYISAQPPIQTLATGEMVTHNHTVMFDEYHFKDHHQNPIEVKFEVKIEVYFTDIFEKERKAESVWLLQKNDGDSLAFMFHRQFEFRPPVHQRLSKITA